MGLKGLVLVLCTPLLSPVSTYLPTSTRYHGQHLHVSPSLRSPISLEARDWDGAQVTSRPIHLP